MKTKNIITTLLVPLLLFAIWLLQERDLFWIAFQLFAIASLALTCIFICACALNQYLVSKDERRAWHDFHHNPFREDKKLTARTFPQIILRDRPKADLVLIHQGPMIPTFK